ncbi:MAG: hypothetical protein P4L33_16740 [Capsulimonadaceae bacterium]|nr:hypothetical protein [Capsulimonadaceae bacterium]
MSTIDKWKLVRSLDRQASGQVKAQVQRPMVTTRQATSDVDAMLATIGGAAGTTVSLNAEDGGERFLWDLQSPFGWDSGEWD